MNRYDQVLSNGTIKVHAKLEKIPDFGALPLPGGKYIRIDIEDEGTGIPKHLQKKVFDPYFTTKKTGNGLGLITSYQIIKNHGGYISFYSEENKETDFYFYLPASNKKKTNELQNGKKILNLPKKILVLDDEESIHKFFHRISTRLKIQIDTAYTAEETIEKYTKAKQSGKGYEIVLLDLTIPGGAGGEEAIKMIREFDPTAIVIVSSGYSNSPVFANYKDYGFNDYLKKPYTIDQLKDILSKYTAIGKNQDETNTKIS
ncbi:MAG: ATP-binding protein [Promethearchaeota archaeon]